MGIYRCGVVVVGWGAGRPNCQKRDFALTICVNVRTKAVARRYMVIVFASRAEARVRSKPIGTGYRRKVRGENRRANRIDPGFFGRLV